MSVKDRASVSGRKKSTRGVTFDTSTNSPKRGTLRRSDHVFGFKVEDILTRAFEHEKYSKGGIGLTGLPKFDDLKSYGISASAEKKLWTLEIRRLVADAESERPMLFSSNGILKGTDPASFESLSNLADQIISNFAVIEHDNTLHVLEHCRWSGTLSAAVPNFKHARTRLKTRYEQDEEKVKARRPKILDPPKNNQEVYFALVDYITSIVARLVVRSASSEFWNNHSLAILAKWAAKLKVLSYSPAQYASTSLDAAEDLIARMIENETKENLTVLKFRFTDTGERNDEMDIDAQAEADITGYYFQDHYVMRANLASILDTAVSALYASEKTGNPPDCFEVCTLVYETGLERSLAVVSNDRRGDVVATSDTTHVTCSYAAFQTLIKNAEHLKSISQPPRGNGIEQTSVSWQWSEGVYGSSPTINKFSTLRVDDIVSVMVPLALSDSHTGVDVGVMLDYVTGNSEEEDPVLQFEKKHFTAKFVVTTAAWKLKAANAAHKPDPFVVPVSESPLDRFIRAGTIIGNLDSLSDLGQSQASKTNKQRNPTKTHEYKETELQMNEWIIAETTVTLKCYGYVYTVLFVCALFICGAMAVPFTVQNRLRGVDPFNITTFTWLLAGFVLVIAKSRYVCEWPWHDFLRGRVVCKSIKEMADVTGIKAQMILTSLLHNEKDTTLITKGPYNGMFERRTEPGNEGFSIDIPIQLSTMIASGFVVLKVLSVKGERLICLDVRKGSSWGGGVALRNKRMDYLTCTDPEDGMNVTDNIHGDKHQTLRTKVLRISRVKFMWTRVLGVYKKDSLFG